MMQKMLFRGSRAVRFIALAFGSAFVGGTISFFSLAANQQVWRLNWHLFLIYVSYHVVLMGLLLCVCSLLGLSLTNIRGIAKSLGVAIVGTMIVVVLVLVLGGHAVVGLLFSGLAFRTSFLATLVYASLAPRFSHHVNRDSGDHP
jgi:uncharacterized membrane protein